VVPSIKAERSVRFLFLTLVCVSHSLL
jgi:hypothetical protein